jgi:hypothetical protein
VCSHPLTLNRKKQARSALISWWLVQTDPNVRSCCEFVLANLLSVICTPDNLALVSLLPEALRG